MAKMNESVDISEIPTDNQNSKVHESLTETGTMSYTKAYEKILRERESEMRKSVNSEGPIEAKRDSDQLTIGSQTH